MLRKLAKVINKEYVEYTEDEGPVHPSTQEEKSSEFQSELLPINMGRTMTTIDLDLVKPTGMRLA